MRKVTTKRLKKGVNDVELPVSANIVGFDYLTMVYEYNATTEHILHKRKFEVVVSGSTMDEPEMSIDKLSAGWTIIGLATASNALPCVIYEWFNLM